MRRYRTVLVALGWLLAVGAAQATDFLAPLDLARLTENARRIVLVTVESRTTGVDRRGLPATVYRLRVKRALKGRAKRLITVKQFGVAEPVLDPSSGAIIAPVHGMPVYEVGGRYLIFLNDTSRSGFTSPVGLDYGAFAVGTGGSAANAFANAGLLPAGAGGASSPVVAGVRHGPLPLATLLAETRRLVGGKGGRVGRGIQRPSAGQRVVTPLLRANIGALFNGNPIRYNVPSADNPGGTVTSVPWDVETGTLGSLSNATATSEVASAFAKWTAPATTTMVVDGSPGSLGVDYDATCPGPTCYTNVFGVFGDGLSPVIYDNDGSITNDLTGSSCGFGGFGGFSGSTSDGGLTWTIESYVVYDGKWLGTGCFGPPLTAAQFRSTFVHELGHFLGLGHVLVNGEYVMNNEPVGGYGVPPCASVEIMMSNAIPGCVRPDTLQKDDVASISQLYPSASFGTTLGTVTGHVYQSDGSTGFNCGNVIVRNDADPFFDAFGTISGISQDFGTPPAGQTGLYRARGLTPGANYIVGVNQLPAFASGGSNITGLCVPVPTLPGPEDYYNGPDESANPSIDNPDCTTFVSPGAGATVSGIDIVFNTSSSSTATCASGGTTTTTTTSTSSTTSSSSSSSTSTSTSSSTSTSMSTLPPLCAPSPVSGCQASASLKGKVSLIDGTPDTKDKIGWKWVASTGTTRADFGDPLNTTTFALCVYDGGGLRFEGKLPAGGMCATKPCWQDKTTVVKYGDRDLTPDGMQKATIKPGAALKGKISAKGKGANLGTPGLPLVGTVTVQLVRSDAATPCWETTHTTAQTNDGLKYKAKSD